jgi:hypothetical protein
MIFEILLSEFSFMKRAIFLSIAAFVTAGSFARAQVPAPAAQTQAPLGTNPAPVSPAQTMGAPVPDTNAPPTASQTSGLLSPPPDNAPAATPAPAAPAAATPTVAPATTTVTTTSPAVAPNPDRQMSRSEIQHIQQQEIIRRQELMFRADQAMDAGHRAELGQRYPEARQNYLFAAQAYGSVSRNTSRFHRAAEGLARVDFQLFNAALQIADTARAKNLIDEIV